MTKRIALQLYSVRDEAAKDFEGTVRRVAEMGYPAVETAGFPGSTAQKAARLFEELGLTVTSAHMGLPLGERKQEALETLEALGKPALVCTQIGPDDVKSVEAIERLCGRLNEGYGVARDNGIAFGVHNHWWEFGMLNGRLVHHYMLERLDPGIFFELDTYWIKVGGQDPIEIGKAAGSRAPMLHIKDGPAVFNQPMTAVGDGVIDIPGIIAAAVPDAWQIVEMDSCATDVMVAAKKSYDYLAGL